MSKVLYNKYRSADFDQLVGQDHITKILKNAVKNDKVSHAYLFTGSRGTGKTSTARIMAKALNCRSLKKDGNPCGKCENCIAISEGRFLDLIEIDAASNRGIDQIRELKEKIEFSPVEGKYKMYIIDEVHMLTKEAFNALLKTLEEPPIHVVFILATTDVHKLPPTILSRCQRYDFKLGSEKEIKKTILSVAKEEGVSLEEGAVNVLVSNARGSYRDALSLLDVVVSGQISSEKPEEVSESEVRKILGIPDTTMVYYFLEGIVHGDGKKVLELVEEIESKGVNISQFVKYILVMLQDILVKKIGGKWNEKEYSFANDLTSLQISSLINIYLGVDRNIRYSNIPSLLLEMTIPSAIDLLGKYEENTPTVIKREVKIEKKVVEEKKEVRSEIKKESEIPKLSKNLTFEEISSTWPKVVEKVRPANGHLFAFLDGAKLLEYDNGTLKLEVPYEFHKERIECSNSRDAINNVFLEIFGGGIKVVCVVNGDAKRKRQVSADVVLSNAPKTEIKKKDTTPHKVSKKVEEIFEGM